MKWFRREHPPAVTDRERTDAVRLRARVDRVSDRTAKRGEELTEVTDALAEVVRRAMRGRPA